MTLMLVFSSGADSYTDGVSPHGNLPPQFLDRIKDRKRALRQFVNLSVIGNLRQFVQHVLLPLLSPRRQPSVCVSTMGEVILHLMIAPHCRLLGKECPDCSLACLCAFSHVRGGGNRLTTFTFPPYVSARLPFFFLNCLASHADIKPLHTFTLPLYTQEK